MSMFYKLASAAAVLANTIMKSEIERRCRHRRAVNTLGRLVFTTLGPLTLGLLVAAYSPPAHADTVTVFGTPGVYGAPGNNGGPGGDATATTPANNDPSNTANATGGAGGNGGNGGWWYPYTAVYSRR
jgi:hypothetical protein